MANSGKQQRMIDYMFQRVDKEQRLMVITQELKVLSKEMEKHNLETTCWKTKKILFKLL
jgi:hypothetical protein